jgi:hypothetical protein
MRLVQRRQRPQGHQLRYHVGVDQDRGAEPHAAMHDTVPYRRHAVALKIGFDPVE